MRSNNKSLARPVLRALAGGDEYGCRAGFDVGGVPGAGRVYGVLAGVEDDGVFGAVGMLLAEGDSSGGAEHDFAAERVHFPHVPGLVESEQAHQSAFDAVGLATRAVVAVPVVGAGEFGLDDGRCVEAEVNGVHVDVVRGHGLSSL